MAEKMGVIELLLKQGLITRQQVNKAEEEVKRTGLTIESALEKLGIITEEDIAAVRAQSYGIPYMDLKDYIIDGEVIKLIPEDLARKHKVTPLFKIGGSRLTVAMVNPQDIMVIDIIRKVSGIDFIETVLSTEKGIQRILDSYYSVIGSFDEIVKSIEKADITTPAEAGAQEAPVIKLVNILIMEAYKSRASDIHVEPEKDTVRVRYRIDGILYEKHVFSNKLRNAVISRIKILSNMDIAESRRPQDGKVRMKLADKDLDIRVSTFPTVHGENVVMRLLDKTSVLLGLKDLGFSQSILEDFTNLIRRPNGIILVTGPTGSGKTTTLYAAVTAISSMEKNIITIEDPVEYELPLIRQTQVNPKAGVTFANGMRSILRQDPDVIMVGEIRDKETAEIAIQAALTGHLVFSTLHTNDASAALTRMLDRGVESFLASSSIIGVLAQRLVRVICSDCKEEYRLGKEELKSLGLLKLYRGKGCSKCMNTGYKGRVGIFELLVVDDNIRKLINARAPGDEIRKQALKTGMVSLKESGLQKVRQAITTIEEVLRVTREA
ncbi:MAG: Flp pilus assembly complex ATPase component TadA [Candidatus Omnitrophota bacterium]|nr:MAG: Flp pilus assembly complex ATPase component TadA [Candidatus Omnitrophota bacterium]